MSSSQTLLQWGDKDNQGITSSGGKLKKKGHVFFKDESMTKGRITLIIEPPTPSATVTLAISVCDRYLPARSAKFGSRSVAHGYFFERNSMTGNLDLTNPPVTATSLKS